MSCIPSFWMGNKIPFPLKMLRSGEATDTWQQWQKDCMDCSTGWGIGKAGEEEHCSPHKRGCYNARSPTSEDWTSLHHTHNAPFIPLEGMNYSHPNTKQKLDSLQEKLSVCQSLHHCTVITSLEVSKGTKILFCWWIAETFHFLHEMLNRTLLPPTHIHS